MKKFIVPLAGLAVCYPLYYFVAHNNGILSKIPFTLVALISWYLLITNLMGFLKEKSYYSSLGKFFLALSIALSIITYGTFDRITFGSTEEQASRLEESSSFAVGKIVGIEYFSAVRIKRKDLPEHWEIKYQFQDSLKNTFTGTFNRTLEPALTVGDTLLIRYVKDNPEINRVQNE